MRAFFWAGLLFLTVAPISNLQASTSVEAGCATALLPNLTPAQAAALSFPDDFDVRVDIRGYQELRELVRSEGVHIARIRESAKRYRSSWLKASLSRAVVYFLGEAVYAYRSDSGRKIIIESYNEENPYRIVDDPVGHYFRVQIKGLASDSEIHEYTDFTKRAYEKGLPRVRVRSEYERHTHFDYSYEFELEEQRVEDFSTEELIELFNNQNHQGHSDYDKKKSRKEKKARKKQLDELEKAG